MHTNMGGAMSADGATTWVPELRFPEFRGAGGWQLKPLGDLAKPISERVGTINCVPMSITTGVGLVSQEEKFGRTIAGDSYKNYIRLQTDDFAYNKSATKEFPQGYIARYSGDENVAVPNSIFSCFRPDTAAVLPDYLDHLFHGNFHGRWLRRYITIGARAHGALSVSDDDLMSMPVPVPPAAVSLPEQQKIADCLGSLDELIASESRKSEGLRKHKEGLLQQLFPLPGKTVPHLRFPDFRYTGDWEEMSIQEMIDKQLIVGHLDGNHGELYPKPDEFTQDKDGVPYISANDFMNGSVDFTKCKRLPLERARLFKKGVARDGDILFAHNATVGPVAKLNTTAEFVVLSTTATYFRCNAASLSNDFLKFGLSSPAFVKQYSSVMAQSTRNQVPITTQRKLKLYVTTLLEQQRVAACLSALDDLIVAQARKIGVLKIRKRSLLRRLVPHPRGNE